MYCHNEFKISLLVNKQKNQWLFKFEITISVVNIILILLLPT